MTGKQSPFWNQDAITAAGLAFAGMSVLQSKLFAPVSWTGWPWLRHLSESHLIQWWPLLLIAVGIALWITKARERVRTRATSPSRSWKVNVEPETSYSTFYFQIRRRTRRRKAKLKQGRWLASLN